MSNRISKLVVALYLVCTVLMTTGCPGHNMSDFVGSWVCTDPNRNYSEYHAFVELYGNGTCWVDEYFWGINLAEGQGAWVYSGGVFWIKGPYDGGEFSGDVEWGTDTFRVIGYWSNGTSGTVDFVRTEKNALPAEDTTPKNCTLPIDTNHIGG